MSDTKTERSSHTMTNLLIGGGLSVLLIPPLMWSIPPERSDGKWILAVVLLIMGTAAPFVRDHGRRFLYRKDSET